ncbi:hypothetical protein GGF32_002216 [Allomyces javanicus]|nr:hypothetical protein GGF32_002216 [Allomyces javanicus]
MSAAAARSARRLLQVSLFKTKDCGLCEEAKHVIQTVQKRAAKENVPFELREVDIHDPESKGAYLKYMFDVPVVHLQDTLWGMHRVDAGKLLNDVTAAAALAAQNNGRTPLDADPSNVVPLEDAPADAPAAAAAAAQKDAPVA